MIIKINRRFPFIEVKQSRAWAVIIANTYKPYVSTPADYSNLAKAGYQQCIDSYECINKIAEAVAAIPFYLVRRRGNQQTEIEDHELLTLLDKPNPQMGGQKFREAAIKYLLIAGNSYIERAGPNGKGIPPKELYLLRPDRVKIIPGDSVQLVRGYRYEIGGQKQDFDFGQVQHLKYFHPTDDWYGLSPLEVAAKGIDISNLFMAWNASLLKNDCKPPGAFFSQQRLSDDDRQRLEEEVVEKWAGSENAGRPLLLEGGSVEWKPFSISPRDMDYLNAEKMTTRKICRIFGVPPELLGDNENKTYSNYKEARLAFYMETILPLAYFFRDELNNWLTPLFGEDLSLEYDIDQVEALSVKREEAYTRLASAWWLTLNEKRIACGYEEIPTGDDIYVPLGMSPMGTDMNEPPKSREMKAIHLKGYWRDPKRKEMLWHNFVQRVNAKGKSFEADAMAFLKKQGEEIKNRLSQYASVAAVKPHIVFEKDKENKKYAEHFKARYFWLFQHGGNAGMRATRGKLYDFEAEEKAGGPFLFNDKYKAEVEKLIMNSAKYINDETMNEILRMMQLGDTEAWTMQKLANEMVKKIDDLSRGRARRISVTETAKVENWANIEGYRQEEFVNKKGWICTFLPTSREEHMAADSQEVLLDEDFTVGGERLQYPGDPKGSAGNIIQCLCATYPVVE